MAELEVRYFCSLTTQFDRLCKIALKTLYPDGSSRNWFRAPHGSWELSLPQRNPWGKAENRTFVNMDSRWALWQAVATHFEIIQFFRPTTQ